ncbi:MAG: MFS transporter [Pseudomonadales bacterium]
MDKLEIRTAASIGLLYVIRMLGLFMVLPVLPLLGPELEAATPALIGIALGIYGLSQACLQIPLGLASDRYGRKSIIVAGLAVFVVGSIVAGMSDHVYGVIAGRFLQGCGAIASTLMALMSDLTRVHHRSKSMAIIGMSIGASFAVSLILGPLLASKFGLAGVFNFAAVAGLAGIGVVLFLIPTPQFHTHNLDSVLSSSRLGQVLADKSLLAADFSIFMVHYLLMSSFIAFPLLMRGTGIIEDSDHHYVYLGVLLVTFVLMGPLMWLSDKNEYIKPMLVAMVVILAVSLVLLANFTGVYGVLAAMMLFFMAFNLLEVILPSLVSKISPAGARGTAMGIYSTGQFLGVFAGGALGGLLLSWWEISHLMYVNAAMCGLWFLVTVTMKRPADMSGFTVQIPEELDDDAKGLSEALSSVEGVLDVVVIEKEHIAYLKVDNNRFHSDALEPLGFNRQGVALEHE